MCGVGLPSKDLHEEPICSSRRGLGCLRRARVERDGNIGQCAQLHLRIPKLVQGKRNLYNKFSTFDPLIQAALNQVASLYSDPITVNILFNGGNLGGGASSQTTLGYTTYTNWTSYLSNDLTANSANTTLQTAINHLNAGNDSGGTSDVYATSTNFRAVGQSAPSFYDSDGVYHPGGGQAYDGVITITPNNTTVSTIEHEIDEILGGGGPGSRLTTFNADPANGYGALDLYRYSAANTPSFDNSTSITSYLSVDGGVSDIANFNQTGSGDYGAFTKSPCNIQSYQVCSGAPAYTTSSPEYRMMLALGYDPVSTTPLPATLPVFVSGLGVIGLVARKRRKSRAAVA